MGTNVSTTYITAPAKKKQTLGIKLQFLVMIIKNVIFRFSYLTVNSLKNSLHLKFKSWMIKILEEGLEHPIIKQQQE